MTKRRPLHKKHTLFQTKNHPRTRGNWAQDPQESVWDIRSDHQLHQPADSQTDVANFTSAASVSIGRIFANREKFSRPSWLQAAASKAECTLPPLLEAAVPAWNLQRNAKQSPHSASKKVLRPGADCLKVCTKLRLNQQKWPCGSTCVGK